MGRYSRIWTVYKKELIETLRDRRTLMAMVFVPIVLYPVLMLVLVQALSSEKGRQEQREYRVVVPTEAQKQWLEGVLANEDAEVIAWQKQLEAMQGSDAGDTANTREQLRTRLGSEQIKIAVADDPSHLWDLVRSGLFHAAVITREIDAQSDAARDGNRLVHILYSDTSPLSEVVSGQLNRILSNEAERQIRTRVESLAGSLDVLTPVITSNLSTTSPDRQFAKALALIVPFLLVTMTVTGAMYPAIDLTAGERERGTLETLAVSPVPTGQIVAGKFGVIVTIAMLTTTLNLASMTAVIHYGGIGDIIAAGNAATTDLDAAAAEEALLENPAKPGSMEWLQKDHLQRRKRLEMEKAGKATFVAEAVPVVLLSMIPFAVLFGGVMLAVCSFARTFKEAQNYMMPVMMSAIVPAMVVSYMPTIELKGVLTVIPVANIVILMRELFLGNFEASTVALCLISTCFYAAAAVVTAARIYGNESVLFSDVGSYKTLLQRKFLRPAAAPSASFAILLLAVLFPINFYVQSSLGDPMAGWQGLAKPVVVTQLLLFAATPIFLAWYMKLDLVNTFSLRMPKLIHLALAVVMGLAVVPVSLMMSNNVRAWFGSEQSMAQFEALAKGLEDAPVLAMILVFAVLPGICEEFAFRGFLQAGLKKSMAPLQAALVVGLVFGIYHIQVVKIPTTALLGVVLAIVCWRTRSLWPGVIVHICNNGFALVAQWLSEKGKDDRLADLYGLSDLTITPTAGITLRDSIFLAIFLGALALIWITSKPEAGPQSASSSPLAAAQ